MALCWLVALGSACLLYLAASFLLLLRPTLLHRRRKLAVYCRNIAHRGGAAEVTENTLEAFRHAKQVGADMFELDVRLTKDSQVVVAHDGNIERITGEAGHISEFNYDDLPPIKECIGTNDSHFFKREVKAHTKDGRKFALLEDVFREFPNTPINIDFKVDDEELIRKVHEMICSHYRQSITCWGSFIPSAHNRLHEVDPTIPTFFSLKSVVLVVLAFWTGLLPFLPLKGSCLEVPLFSSFFGMDSVKNGPWYTKPILRFANLLLARPAMIAHLRARGIAVYLWVLNEEKDWEDAMNIGATGIMTDRPEALQIWYHRYTRTSSVPYHIHAPSP